MERSENPEDDGVMSHAVMVVDRSIPVGQRNMAEVVAWRQEVGAWVARHLAKNLAGVVVFSETARVDEQANLEDGLVDLVYGSNLEDAFEVAGELCEQVHAGRVIVISYSAPSAHRLGSGEVIFALPPTKDALAAAEAAAERCRQAGLTIDAIVLDVRLDEPDQGQAVLGEQFHDLPAALGAITRGPVIRVPLNHAIQALQQALPTA